MLQNHILTVALALLMISAGVLAQPAAAPPTQPAGPDPNQPPAESVYARIPADCVGFLATNNVKDLLTDIETFAGEIGQGEMLEAMSPDGLLPMIAMQLGLGEGYNPNGGLAVVMTNLERSGVDVDSLFSGEASPDIQPPLVILIAGTSAEEAFPTLAQKGEDGSVIVMLPFGGGAAMHTDQLGDYIAISPSLQALAAMKGADAIGEKLPAGQKKLLDTCNVVLHENLQAILPLIEKAIESKEKPQQDAAGATQPATGPTCGPAGFGRPSGMLAAMTPFVDMLADMESATYGLRRIPDGLMVDMAIDYRPDSRLGKLVASYTNTAKPLMDRLPNLPYVLAGGMVMTSDPEYTKMMVDMVEMLLALGDLEMPADLKDRMIALGTALGEEVTEMQIVGGAPKGKGLFGAAMVVECKDAAKVKELIPQKAELLTELIQKTVAVKEEDLASLAFTHVKNVETIGEMSVDAIVVDHEDFQEEEQKADLLDVFGEEQLRFLMVQVDEKTLVVTFGGTTDFLAEAISAAQGKAGPPVSKDLDVVKALAKLPSERVSVMVFSPKNLFDTVQAGMKKMDEASDLPEGFTFEGTAPLAIVSVVNGTTAGGELYIPSSAVKDVIFWITTEMAASAAPPASAPATAPATAPAE